MCTRRHLAIKGTANSPVVQSWQQASAADVFYLRKLAKGKSAYYDRKIDFYCQGKSHKVTHKRRARERERHILSSFYRPVLTLGVLRPALAGGLINWSFHLVNVHCVSGFVCIWICECTPAYVCVRARTSAWVHCLSCEVFGFLTEGCCHCLWKRVIGAHSPGMNTHPYTCEKMWHFKKTRDNRTEKW